MDTADNTPLQLQELTIPDGGPAYPPAPVGSVGINIAAARLAFPHDGLRLVLPPWPNMGRGDAFRIKLGTIPVVTGSINEDTEVDEPVVRHIAVGGLVDGDFDLSYDVRIVGASNYEPSAVTKIHVKIEFAPPGGQDQDGDTPGHSELRLTIPPEFLPPGAVDQEAARLGVPVTIEPYPIMAEGDRIKMSWGGEIIWKTVGPEHFPPQNQPLVITVDEETILNGKDSDDSGLPVVFEVYDRVDNKSEDFSAEVRVIVDTGNSRLDAPLIEEVFNLELDVDQLGEADLTFQVIAVGSHFKVDDEVEMSLTGTTAEGEKIEEVIFAREKILSVPNVLMFKRPSAEVRQLAGGPHAAFFYRLIKADGSDDLFSKIFSPRIVGRANPLAAPIPLDEIAGTLDPQLPSTTIEIPLDPAMEEGNAIELIWNGTKANGTSYKPDLPPHPITANEAEGSVPIEIVVVGEHLTAIEGGTLDLYYKLLRDVVSREVLEEESLHADLLSIGEPRAELPLPVVEGESGGVLDPADKPDGTRLIVRQYSGQTAGDRVHMLWWGSNTGRYRDSIPVTGSTENQNIPFTIRAALIEGNRDGTVRAMYWVKRVGGGTSASEILNISIGVQAIPTLDNVKDANGVEIPEGTSAVTTSVSVNGTASKGRDVEIYDGSGASAVLKGTRTADPVTGMWSLANIAVAEGGRRFYAKALYNTGGTPYSNVRLFTVVAAMNLTAPSVKQASGATPNQQLNPVAAKDALTVVIPDYGIQPGDQVSVTWAGTAGAGSHTTPVQALPGSREIPLPVSVLAFNLDRSVTVTYTVTRDGSEGPASAPLTLNVQAMPATSLAMPLIPQAAQGGLGRELDLTSFTGNAGVTCAPWPLIAAGQRVWLRAEGIAQNGGGVHIITLYTASAVNSSEVSAGLVTDLLRSELIQLRDGSELKVILQVTFNRTSNQAQTIDFPLRRYTVVVVPPLSIDTTQMTLHGMYIDAPWTRTAFVPPGTRETRQPRGGVPPYRFTSSNPAIATVNSAGTVSVAQVNGVNGVTQITAFDAMDRQVSYPVSVTNIWKLEIDTTWITSLQAYQWGNFGNYSFHPIEEKYSLLKQMYVLPNLPAGPYWTCGRHANGDSYWIDLRTGDSGVHSSTLDPTRQLHAVRLIRR